MEIEVEMLDRSQVPEEELKEFQQAEVVEITDENEGQDIREYVQGESKFPEYYQTIQIDDDEEEDDLQNLPTTSTSSKKNKKPIKKRSVLDASLQGLMGQANLSYAKGQVAIAEKICLEIIRQNPLASEPFFTLADIYENKDDEKYLNFLTIAAHLDPTNRDNWIRIAEMQIQKKNFQKARVFYSKAIKYIPKDYDIRLRKGKLLEQMNDTFQAMMTYMKMIPYIPPEQFELALSFSRIVAEYFYKSKKFQHALVSMQNAYNVVGRNFTHDHINLYLELLIIEKNYSQVLQVLMERTQLDIDLENGMVVNCEIPNGYLNDLRVKLCVSLIHLQCFHMLAYLLNNIAEYIPITETEWYMDIAEALMKENKFQETLSLIDPIIQANYDTPAYVHLRYAECHRSLGNIDEAIEGYFRVIDLAPNCFEAKFTLSALLKATGRYFEAIQALEQDIGGDSFHARMLYERCLMLKTVNDIDEYIDVGYVLLARHTIKLRNRDELVASTQSGGLYTSGTRTIVAGRKLLTEIATEMGKVPGTSQKEKEKGEETDLTIEEEIELFYNLLEVVIEQKKYATLQKICYSVSFAKRFHQKLPHLDKLMIITSYLNNDTQISFHYLRDVMNKKPKSAKLWNFLALLIQKGENVTTHRFVRRFVSRHTLDPYVKIFLGNWHLFCNSLKYALNFYVPIQQEIEQEYGEGDPLIYLCIATCFQQLSMQKKILHKSVCMGQAIAFMSQYEKVRMAPSTKCEIYYNYGRLFHQANMQNVAMHYYTEALKCSDDFIQDNEEMLGLKQEIAFNLHLMFKQNGNNELALKYLYDYCVI